MRNALPCAHLRHNARVSVHVLMWCVTIFGLETDAAT